MALGSTASVTTAGLAGVFPAIGAGSDVVTFSSYFYGLTISFSCIKSSAK